MVRFIRMTGEGFDADQVTLPCEECGLSEYSCECNLVPACDHYVSPNSRNLECRNCGAAYHIGLNGCEWINPAGTSPCR